MLYVEPSGGTATLFSRGFKNLFFAQPGTTTTEPDRFMQWITSLPASSRPKTAAYITADDPSASPAVAAFKSKLQALGVKTVYDRTYSPNTSNFDTVASTIAHASPDLVIQGAVASDGAQFVQSLQRLSFSPKFLFQTNAPADATYATAVGGGHNADGIFTAEAWSPNAKYPGNAAFVTAYKKSFGHAPSEDAANSYTAGQVLAAAVKAVGRIDQAALQNWLHSHTVSTIVGPLRWNAAGDPEGSLLLAQWQRGTLQIVAPPSVATSTRIVNPKPAWNH
jgi:branched-chain amino acid transport system substrate-binding protein